MPTEVIQNAAATLKVNLELSVSPHNFWLFVPGLVSITSSPC